MELLCKVMRYMLLVNAYPRQQRKTVRSYVWKDERCSWI
jgi:hypothetical protein